MGMNGATRLSLAGLAAAGAMASAFAPVQAAAADVPLRTVDWLVAGVLTLVGISVALAFHTARLAKYVRERDASQKALVASEARFRAFAEASPASITIKDRDGRYLFVNRHLATRWGVRTENCIGRTPAECLPPLFAGLVYDQDREVVESGAVHSFETRVVTPDGSIAHELVVKFPIFGDGGEFSGIGTVATDATELKKTEDALARTIRALRTLSAGNEVLVRAGSENELIERVCRIVVEKGGYPFARVGYVTGTDPLTLSPVASFGGDTGSAPPICTLTPLEGAESCPAYRAAASGKISVGRDLPDRVDLACRLGADRNLPTTAIALPLKNDREVLGVLTILSEQTDVFDHEEVSLLGELAEDLAYGIGIRRAEAERRRAEETVRILYQAVDQSAGAVIVVDCLGIVRHVNRRLRELTGYRPEDTIERPLGAPDASSESIFGHARRLIAVGREWTEIHRTERKDGSAYWAQTSVSPVCNDEGQATHYVLMHKDVSDRIETERRLRQAEKMEALGKLAGGIAHDFNNMLLPIRALSTMVLRDLRDSPQARRMERVVEAASRAEELVRRILTFSRSGESERKNEDLAAVVHEAVELLRATVPRSIAIQEEIHAGVGHALVNRAQIQTVLLNLGSNAAQAMAGRVGHLAVSLRPSPPEVSREMQGIGPGAHALLTIEDTGDGIDPAILPRIFEPFFTTKRVGEGTGLGLSMVHGIVTEHGGAISVDSAVGRGTVFRILLPLLDDVSSPATESPP